MSCMKCSSWTKEYSSQWWSTHQMLVWTDMFTKDDGPMVEVEKGHLEVILSKLGSFVLQLAAMRFHHLANWLTKLPNFELAFFKKV